MPHARVRCGGDQRFPRSTRQPNWRRAPDGFVSRHSRAASAASPRLTSSVTIRRVGLVRWAVRRVRLVQRTLPFVEEAHAYLARSSTSRASSPLGPRSRDRGRASSGATTRRPASTWRAGTRTQFGQSTSSRASWPRRRFVIEELGDQTPASPEFLPTDSESCARCPVWADALILPPSFAFAASWSSSG